MLHRFPSPDGPSRWNAVREALVGPTGIVTMLEHRVRFGVVMWSSGSTPMPDPDVPCPIVLTTPTAVDGRAAIDDLFTAHTALYGSGTPTGDALAYAFANLAELVPSASDGQTIFVLATDGVAGSCMSHSTTVGEPIAIEQAQAVHAGGIDTYVLSVGGESEAQFLQRLANAGQGLDPDTGTALPWIAMDSKELATQIAEIVNRGVSCQLELDGTLTDLDQACRDGDVTLGSDSLTCGTDWQVIDSTHIEIIGDACTRLHAGTGDELVARFPCAFIF
jgi:hypothetical protein